MKITILKKETMLYLEDLSKDKKYVAQVHKSFVDIEIDVIDVINQIVRFHWDNEPMNGGGVVHSTFNQIECNRYMEEK